MQTGWKCESIFFRLILGYLFISPDKTQPIEWPVYQCMRQRQGFQGTLCCLAGTAATNARQHWYCEVSAYVEKSFDFSRVSQCSWSCIKHYLLPFCVKRTYSVVFILLWEPNFAVDGHNTENVRLLLSVSFADNSEIEDLKNALVNLSRLELSLLHTCTWDFAFHTHQVVGILPMNHSNWRQFVVSRTA